jgi:hypothetical protein
MIPTIMKTILKGKPTCRRHRTKPDNRLLGEDWPVARDCEGLLLLFVLAVPYYASDFHFFNSFEYTKLEKDLIFFLEYACYTYSMNTQNKIFFFQVLQKSIKSRRRLAVQCFSDNPTLHFVLSHYALVLYCGEKLTLLKVIALNSLQP